MIERADHTAEHDFTILCEECFEPDCKYCRICGIHMDDAADYECMDV